MAVNPKHSSRLFLPLTSQAFEWYSMGKDIEVRSIQGRFKNIQNYNYEYAELRKGYSGKSIFAKILDITIYSSITQLLSEVDYKRVIPCAVSINEAELMLRNYINNNYLVAMVLDLKALRLNGEVMGC